jgi:hypothetical protein
MGVNVYDLLEYRNARWNARFIFPTGKIGAVRPSISQNEVFLTKNKKIRWAASLYTLKAAKFVTLTSVRR